MNVFPWGVSIGLGLVLIGTLYCIFYILTLDKREENVSIQNQTDRQSD